MTARARTLPLALALTFAMALAAALSSAAQPAAGPGPEGPAGYNAPPSTTPPPPKEEPMRVDKYDKQMRADEGAKEELRWHAPTEAPFRLSGFAWFEQDHVYRRMPLKPPAPLPRAVDRLADATSGGQIQFQTDSRKVAVRVKLSGAANMVHMPATGQCGFDCYIGPPGAELFARVAKYDLKATEYEVVLAELPDAQVRQVRLDFPLYTGVKEVLVGLEPGAQVLPPLPYADDRPVVVYGTSITQGGCASRPGMSYTNILSRRLNRPFVNLGFSGNALGEPEVAQAMAQIPDPALYVLIYEINVDDEVKLQDTLPRFIEILREAHPEVPILIPSRSRFPWENFQPIKAETRLERTAFQRALVEKLRAAGDQHVFFFDATDMLGDAWNECTVDSLHPSDLGFWQMAAGLEPVIRQILETGQGPF